MLSTAQLTLGPIGILTGTGVTKSLHCALVNVWDVMVRGMTCEKTPHFTPIPVKNCVMFSANSARVFDWYDVCPLYTVYPAGKVMGVAALD